MRLIVILSLLLLAACNQQPLPPLLAGDVELLAPLPGTTTSAGYLSLTNNSADEIRITKVTSPQFEAVEIHETRIENDIARMRPLDSLLIAPGETLRMQRGGTHLMLTRPVREIESVRLVLYSDDIAVLTVDAIFTSPGD